MNTIKDSGSTREFVTGAHRDNATGKGRMDLLPLEEVYLFTNDSVVKDISDFISDNNIIHLKNALVHASENIPCFKSEAIKDMLKKDDILLCEFENKEDEKNAVIAHMLLEVSKIYEDGAKKYGENNWKKGMPLNCYLDSGLRHYFKCIRGDKDEPHYRGFVWNILGAMWTINHNISIDTEINKEKNDNIVQQDAPNKTDVFFEEDKEDKHFEENEIIQDADLDSNKLKISEDSNFLSDYVTGISSCEDINLYIDFWKKEDVKKTLQQFLGMSDKEFEKFNSANDKSIIKDICEKRKKFYDKINYYEIAFTNSEDTIGIVGKREPTISEVTEFLKKDIENYEYGQVASVTQLSKEDAFLSFDMSCITNIPIFK